MIDLGKKSGLPIKWLPSQKRLLSGEAMSNSSVEPEIRKCRDLFAVLFDNQADSDQELYYMYRGVALFADEQQIRDKGLRYDITVIRPGTVGREYIKTAGHYHPEKKGTGITFPEVYEVLYGRAHYLLQRPNPDNSSDLNTVLFIAAKPGDKLLVPPNFGHITINPGDDYLVMSNWVARDFASIYDPFRELGGGAYFELFTEDGPEFIGNKRYRLLPPLQRCPVRPFSPLNLITGLPLYKVFQENVDAFNFLLDPESYLDLFELYLKELTSS